MFKNMVYKNTIKFIFTLAVLATAGLLGYGKGVLDPFILEVGTVPFWWCIGICVAIAWVWFNLLRSGLALDRAMIDAKKTKAYLDDESVDPTDRVLTMVTGNITGVSQDSIVARLYLRIGKSLKTNAKYQININNFQDRFNSELGRRLMWVLGVSGLLTVLGLIGTFAGFMFGIESLGLSESIVFEEIVGKIGSALDGFKTAFATTLYGAVGFAVATYLAITQRMNASEVSNTVITMTDTQVLPVVNDPELVVGLMQKWNELKTQQEES
ncbi:MAG: hypothetical protein VX730_04765 [Pseudomonadota bacterium]|nr:hypothetical protein [Pseudomonadota bacterium]